MISALYCEPNWLGLDPSYDLQHGHYGYVAFTHPYRWRAHIEQDYDDFDPYYGMDDVFQGPYLP